MSGIFKRMIWL